MRRLSWARTGAALACGAAVVLLINGSGAFLRAAEEGVSLPAPIVDQAAPKGRTGTAVLAGGCFWGIQGVFQHVSGVTQVISGYSGGALKNPTYEQVSSETTGHAESVQITFDPTQVTYGTLLRVFFSVGHDPTQLNRQGPDVGTSYRSNIFYTSDDQKRVADAYIAQLNAAKVFPKAIVTRVDALSAFYPAEDYHQDFLINHPTYPYIVINDLPKLEHFRKLLPALYREQPVKVGSR